MPAASGEMRLKLTSSLGSCWGCISPTHRRHLPVFLCFIPSHIRASHSLATTTDTTSSTSHPCSSNPLLIFTLNLVLLSGLCLNTPSEISRFKTKSRAAGAAMLYNCSRHRLPCWCSLTSQKAGIQNKIRFPHPTTNWAVAKALLLRLFVTWWLEDRLKFPMNMDATVYAFGRKKNQAHTWLLNICKKNKNWNAFGKVGYISVLLGVDYFFPVCGIGLSVHTILKRIIWCT